jgi:glycogen synthase
VVLLININFNSHKKKYENLFGAVLRRSDVLIQIGVNRDCEVYLVVDNQSSIEKYKMNKHDFLYSFNLDTSNYTATIHYYFEILYEGKCIYYANNCELLGSESCPYTEKPKNLYQITFYGLKYPTPQWLLQTSIYHIFVDRFYNQEIDLEALNHDLKSVYGGNLKGIIDKLYYIKSLGISTLCLSPIFEADEYPQYHTRNYEKIESRLGGKEVFESERNEKLKIQRKYGLDFDENNPLFVSIGHLFEHKGIELLISIADGITYDYQLIVRRTGIPVFEKEIKEKYLSNDNLITLIEFNSEIALKQYQSVDFILMPSEFEPCGIAQLIAMYYRTLPIVHNVGGVNDTFINHNLENGYGFKYENQIEQDFLDTVNSQDYYKNKEKLNEMIIRTYNQAYIWPN